MSVPAAAADEPEFWYAMPELRGPRVSLVPLQLEHAEALHAALWADGAGTDVYRWLGMPAPETLEQTRASIVTALAQRAAGQRLPYAQLDTETGALIGTTSYYDLCPDARALAIGYTWFGRPWWRTGRNRESKLLLLEHAFGRLGAARVVWHTDMLNSRSRAAIAGLGARFEGELRKHRIRANGTWRDTAQFAMTDEDWPSCRDRLRAGLATAAGRA